MPRGGPVDSIYRRSLLAARDRSATLSRATQTRILRGYAESLARLDIAEAAGRITAERAAELHAQISSALYSFNDQFEKNVAGGIKTTINDVVRSHDDALKELRDRFGVKASTSFENIDVEVALNLALRRGADSFTSLMKYRLDNNIVPQIDSFLSSAVSRGVSVSETTQDLVRLLANGDENISKALDLIPRGANISRFGVMQAVDLEKYGIDPQYTQAIRSMFADSRRIAVSEINNTLREANATAMTQSPVVEAAAWSRSGAHEGPCECDVLAETDFYGYGPGMYPPDKWPVAPHPNCGCYQGGPMVYRPVSEWGKVKPPSRSLQKDPSDPSIFQRFGFSNNRSSRASSNISSALGEGEMRAVMLQDSAAHPMLPGESKADYQKRRKRERAAARREAKKKGEIPKKTTSLPNPKKKPSITSAPITKPPPKGPVGNPKQLPGESKAEFQKRRRRERAQARKAAAKKGPSSSAPPISASQASENFLERAKGGIEGGLSQVQVDAVQEVLNKIKPSTKVGQFANDIMKALLGSQRASIYNIRVNSTKGMSSARAWHSIRRGLADDLWGEIHLSKQVTSELENFLVRWKQGARTFDELNSYDRAMNGMRTLIHENTHAYSAVASNVDIRSAYAIEKHRFIEEGLVERRARRAVGQLMYSPLDKEDASFFFRQYGSYGREVQLFDDLAKKYGDDFIDTIFSTYPAEARFQMIIDKVANDTSLAKVFRDRIKKYSTSAYATGDTHAKLLIDISHELGLRG